VVIIGSLTVVTKQKSRPVGSGAFDRISRERNGGVGNSGLGGLDLCFLGLCREPKWHPSGDEGYRLLDWKESENPRTQKDPNRSLVGSMSVATRFQVILVDRKWPEVGK
jgi:hypothetical protein